MFYRREMLCSSQLTNFLDLFSFLFSFEEEDPKGFAEIWTSNLKKQKLDL